MEERLEEEEKQQTNLNNSMEQQFQDISNLPQEKLLELAEERFEKFEMEDAAHFYEEAVKKNPDNDLTLMSYGEFLKAYDEVEKAEFVFQRSIELNPEQNCKKYFQLAEFKDGKESLQLYETGVKYLEKDIQNLSKDDIKDLCNAYAAIAELYQTDFVQYQESEKFCTENIEKALKLDPQNLEAKLQLANYFLNKEQPEKAQEPLSFIFDTLQVMEDLPVELNDQQQQNQQNNNNNDLNNFQSLQDKEKDVTQSFKINVAKLLMEVELLKKSQILLEHLTHLDSDNKEYLYLLAFVNFKQQNYYESLEQCQELLGKNFDEDDGFDAEIEAAAKELREELNKADFEQSKDCVMKDQQQQNDQQINNEEDGEEDEQWSDMEEEN